MPECTSIRASWCIKCPIRCPYAKISLVGRYSSETGSTPVLKMRVASGRMTIAVRHRSKLDAGSSSALSREARIGKSTLQRWIVYLAPEARRHRRNTQLSRRRPQRRLENTEDRVEWNALKLNKQVDPIGSPTGGDTCTQHS